MVRWLHLRRLNLIVPAKTLFSDTILFTGPGSQGVALLPGDPLLNPPQGQGDSRGQRECAWGVKYIRGNRTVEWRPLGQLHHTEEAGKTRPRASGREAWGLWSLWGGLSAMTKSPSCP